MYRAQGFWWRLRVLLGASRVAFGPRQRVMLRSHRYPPEPFLMRVWHRLRGQTVPVPPPRPFVPRPWLAEPDSELGVAVPVRQVLVSTPDTAVGIVDCVAYSTGFRFSIAVRTKDEVQARAMGFPGPPFSEAREDQQLQFTVRFADGREGKSWFGVLPPALREHFQAVKEGREPDVPVGPVIGPLGGGGGGRRWGFNYWVWPLPPDGPVTISCGWPSRWSGTISSEVDGAAIRRAGERSDKLW